MGAPAATSIYIDWLKQHGTAQSLFAAEGADWREVARVMLHVAST
jgi:hypothetical protein